MIGEEIRKLEFFRTYVEWADFYDPHCRSHGRRLYRSITNFFNKSDALSFYSNEKNEKFYTVANKIWKNPKTKKQDF